MRSVTTIRGDLRADGKRFAIIGARWNEFFSDRLVEGAVDALLRHGATEEDITVIRVPGSFEVPLFAMQAAKSKRFDAVIAVGVLIKGDTDHYDLIASQVAAGLSRAMLETGVPVTFGVVTADSMEQAMARSGSKAGNKGWESAIAAIETVSVQAQLKA